jgi:hypothetical protein
MEVVDTTGLTDADWAPDQRQRQALKEQANGET